MACAIETIQGVRSGRMTRHAALELKYRFNYHAMEQGYILEGFRAAIIDTDRNP